MLKSRAQRGFSAYARRQSAYAARHLDSAAGQRRHCPVQNNAATPTIGVTIELTIWVTIRRTSGEHHEK